MRQPPRRAPQVLERELEAEVAASVAAVAQTLATPQLFTEPVAATVLFTETKPAPQLFTQPVTERVSVPLFAEAAAAPSLRIEAVRVPPPPRPPPLGAWFFPTEQFYGSFINMYRRNPVELGQLINFEEARRSAARTAGFDVAGINFIGLPMLTEASSLEEHRRPRSGRNWEEFVEMALALRKTMFKVPAQTIEHACRGCREAAFEWVGQESTGSRTSDMGRLMDAFHTPNAWRGGLAAALLDVILFRCTRTLDGQGMALALLGDLLGGLPKSVVENFVFDNGISSGTTFATTQMPDYAPGDIEVPLLQGAYGVTSIAYISALGAKGLDTGGDTIGWRQLHMTPAGAE